VRIAGHHDVVGDVVVVEMFESASSINQKSCDGTEDE